MAIPIGILFILSSVLTVSASNGPPDGPRVCVTYLKNGWKFPWHVRLNETVWVFKKSLAKYYYGGLVAPSHQTLVFQENILDNSQTLEYYNITRHSDIGLIHKPLGGHQSPNKFSINSDIGAHHQPNEGLKPTTLEITIVGTIVFTIDVDLTDTIGAVKTKIYNQEEYPVEEQRLFWGTELEDSRTLEFYGIKDNYTVLLNVPLNWCYNTGA